jgi:Domain of unknown function (DUF4331)
MRRSGRTLAVALAAAAALVLPAAPGLASSHREAPFVATQPQLDSTDLYAFVSPERPDTVTVISNWLPFEEPAGGPNFYPWAPGAHYDVNIDNNGDAKADITYRWTFKSSYKDPGTFLYNTGPVKNLSDATLNFVQTYNLDVIKGGTTTNLLADAPAAPSHTGTASMPDYQALRDQAVKSFGSAGKSYAGQADDPFFLDLRVFDLLYGTNLKEAGHDTLDGYNVNALALQVPKTELAAGGDAAGNPVIGIWTTASVPSVRTINGADGTQAESGDYVQVSRLGMPLVNEVVVPAGVKDKFNASKPDGDAQFLPKVDDPDVPHLIEKIYGIKAPATPRKDLEQVFLTGVPDLNMPKNVTPSEQLRLNMSIAPVCAGNRLGVIGGDTAGFPNGRRLSDDVIDITLQVAEGFLTGQKTGLGDGVDKNDVAFSCAFPYLGLPHSGSVSVNAARAALGTGTGATPVGGVQAGGGGTAPGSGFPVLPAAAGAVGLTVLGRSAVRRRRSRV